MAFRNNDPSIFEFKKKGDMVEGVLIKTQENVGPSKSMLYNLEVKGKPVNVWGCAILDQRMVGIKPGEVIQIIYKGLGEAKPGLNAPKIFQVLVDREDPEESEDSEDSEKPSE